MKTIASSIFVQIDYSIGYTILTEYGCFVNYYRMFILEPIGTVEIVKYKLDVKKLGIIDCIFKVHYDIGTKRKACSNKIRCFQSYLYWTLQLRCYKFSWTLL